jgi:hypothetical protein
MKSPKNPAARVASIAMVAMIAGCGGGGGQGPTAAQPTAVLTLAASPNPVVGDLCGSHCGNLVGEREALTQLTLRETAGVAANVTGGTQELRNTATREVIAMSTYTPDDFIRDAGTTRIPGGGQLVYHAGVHYPAAHAGVAATFTFTLEVRDVNGHVQTVTLAVPTTG